MEFHAPWSRDDHCSAKGQALRLRGGGALCRPSTLRNVLKATAPHQRSSWPCCQLSDMEWRKRNSGDFTARPDEPKEDREPEECVPCAIAAQRGAEIEHAIGLRDEERATGDRTELAIARLKRALQSTASQASQCEALLAVLGEAYVAGVDLDNPWMREAAARVAQAEKQAGQYQ